MADLACIMCYMTPGDYISYIDDEYKIIDNFKYAFFTKYYPDAYRREVREGKIKKFDISMMKTKKTLHMLPDSRAQQIKPNISHFVIYIDGIEYDFSSNTKGVGIKLSLYLAEKYKKDVDYRNYVNVRLKELENYDSYGRKVMSPGEIVHGWKINKYISSGNFGATYIVSKEGQEYVMKTFHVANKSSKTVEKECKITTLAGELGVGPKVIECGTDKGSQYIIMEKLDGPMLKQKYDSYLILPEAEARELKRKIKILDDNHIKHNDLHLGNIMYHKGGIYIIDYGKANIVKGNPKNNMV